MQPSYSHQQSLKKIFKTLAPKPIIACYRYLLTMRRFFSLRKYLKKNKKIHTNENSVVIIANGPSIKHIDLIGSLSDVDVIVMNAFYLHPDAKKLNIVGYCVGELGSDVDIIEVEKILQIPSRRYWFSTDFIMRLSPLSANVHLYMPGNDRILLSSIADLDLSFPAPSYETTAQMSIIVALAMGYQKIILLGFDHDYLASGDYLNHFYEEDNDAQVYRSKLYLDGDDYHTLIQTCDRIWARYKRIKNYAQLRGVEIINCGDNSYLDVFRRRSLQSALRPFDT